MSTQPSEFEQLLERLCICKAEVCVCGGDTDKRVLLTAHNADIAAAERRSVLDNLKLLQEQVGASHALHGDGPEFTKWLSGKFQREIAAYRRALSGQEPAKPCKTCDGSGVIEFERNLDDGRIETGEESCPDCGGTGVVK